MTFLPLLLSLAAGPSIAQEEPFFIGTYTSPNGSEGIYRSSLDVKTGRLSSPILVAKAHNPSFLAINPSGQFLYSVLEQGEGMVNAYSIDKALGLTLLNAQPTKGADPCHLVTDATGKNVLVANYSGGNLSAFPIEPNGRLASASAFFQNSGSGPNKGRQGEPHVHGILADAKSEFVYACDLGTDEVLIYLYDADSGRLTLAEAKAGKVPAGSGPRHLVLSKDGKFLYVNNELTNTVTTFARNEWTGGLTPLQTSSTLPTSFDDASGTAEILLHPNGKWLYVTNRGHDSIAVYRTSANGPLELLEIAKTVAEPRGCSIDPSGKWLVVAGQKSNEIVAMAIDRRTGRLRMGSSRIALDKPVSTEFVNR